MLEQIANALDRRDFPTAAKLIKQMMKQSPDNPWVQFYVGKFYELSGKLEQAENIYRQVLRKTTNPKVVSQARQGLQRLELMEQEKRKSAIAQATSHPENTEPGVLVLEPISPEKKQEVAPKFARLIQLDPYTAKLQLPTRGWKLYRTGAVGELQYYVQQLQEIGIPAFAVALSEIERLNVFQVLHFSGFSTQEATVSCLSEQGQQGTINFQWSEVKSRVDGLLPIFEEVVDLDVRRKMQRKTETLDYAHFCDLHFPERKTILRFCDRTYQFTSGYSFIPDSEQSTIRQNWNALLAQLNQKLAQVPIANDFTPFAETALDFSETLKRLSSHIEFQRLEDPTLWDQAFQLYSGLVFLQTAQAAQPQA